MTLCKIASILIVGTVVAITCDSLVPAQYFLDDKMTMALKQHFEAVAASKYGAAFVSSCQGPEKGETAILVVPLAADSGTLSLLLSGKIYNGGGVTWERGKAVITEGGGGQWSMRKLQFYADTRAKSAFRLESGDQLRAVLNSRPRTRCPAYVGN